MWAHEVAEACGGRLVGPDVSIDGASIDSRELVDGSLFVPIIDTRDGHDFIEGALGRGAAAFLTSRPLDAIPAWSQVERLDAIAAVVVDDTAEALVALGRSARDRLAAEPGFRAAVGITGSVGKTTTKDQLAAVLSTTFRTAASLRSFNNELGVPLTLINAPSGTEVAVVEMGARGRGHIASLCRIARPTIGVVTSVERMHTELFGTLAEAAAAKAELVETLPADGTAVLNADRDLVAAMADRTEARVLRFSATDRGRPPSGDGSPDIWASGISVDAELYPTFTMHTPWGNTDARLAVRGAHNVGNALAAAGAALVAGVTIDNVAAGLGQAQVSAWRMDLRTSPTGARVLNDAYNAGPTSMAAALRALVSLDAARSIAVLGQMAELGVDGPEVHRSIADLAHELGVRVVAVGAPAYGPRAEHVADRDAALVLLHADGALGADDAILVKGSRVAGLEQVAAALLAET